MDRKIEVIKPNDFDQQNHFYPKALNAQLHPLVGFFLNLNHSQLVERYYHLNPQIDPKALKKILNYRCKFLHWGGADLFYVTTERGSRQMVVLETNSCPSGQKSMPPRTDSDEYRGFRDLLENSFLPAIKGKKLPQGSFAVLYDKNYMEVSGYARVMADLLKEEVYLIPVFNNEESHHTFKDGVLYANHQGSEIPIKAAFRYVTQKPWNRLPIHSKTFIFNSTLACLAGGRNKLVANKAYELFNSKIADSRLKIRFPQTIRDVSKLEIPLWVEKFGGYAVIKNPYSNAGQGVYTITSEDELEEFMDEDHDYDQFIVQSLIGHSDWSSSAASGKYYHIGTVPNKKGNIYVADLRMMVYSSPDGIYPCAIYARRAKSPLKAKLSSKENSWQILGTNLSNKIGKNTWESDTSRLMLMDRKDFNTLGIGIDDLIDAFFQTVLSVVAIDQMALNLINKKNRFRSKLFQSLDNDESLLKEIYIEAQ